MVKHFLKPLRLFQALSVGTLLLAAQAGARAEEVKPPAKAGVRDAQSPQFVRVRRDEKRQSQALETAVVSYVAADSKRAGVRVDLIGAVHVGEKSYYDELNRLFTDYDVLLYELVAPEGTRIPKEGRSGGGHPVTALQTGLKGMLELEFQLERVDYTKENFVHADMSPDDFAASMKDRNESFLDIFFRMMGQGIAQQSQDPTRSTDTQLLSALFAKDRPLRLKRIMAEQFESMDGAMAVLDGPEGSTLITERNKKAFEVLARELAAGKQRIGVFYGAGHLPDMEKRLLADFGMKRSGERWLAAWNLASPAAKADGAKKGEPKPVSPKKDAPAPRP